jgi:hypothetical protein
MRSVRRARGLFAAAWMLASLAACQAPALVGTPCARDADCSAALACAFGRCRDECREARDCSPGSRCIALASGGVCALDQENHCDTHVCPSPLACVIDQCRTACARDGDCVSGPCVDGTCAEPLRGVGTAPVARLVSSAYFTDWFGPAYGTSGVGRTGFQISSVGVQDGELLLLIGCIDNGSTTAWPSPLAPGFTQLDQDTWGTDVQTCVVAWKLADHEPSTYAGTYGQGIVSGSSVLALVAITGARSVDPIADYLVTPTSGTDAMPVLARSTGVITRTPDTLVVFAANADWTCSGAHDVSATVPEGFSTLLHLGDQGSQTCDWTWLQIETMTQHAIGPTGPISTTQTSSTPCAGTGWTAALAISP